jgi:hypothetical protein
MAIHSFRDSATEDLFHGRKTSRVRRFHPEIVKVALLVFRWDEGVHDVSLTDYH